MKALFIILLLTFTVQAMAGKAAMVKLVKGEAHVLSGDKKIKLKINDWVEEGAVVKTEPRSFVRLVFLDKSQMNISASSELKIERFHKKDAGVIGLIKGQIRSQVSKDYLQINGKDRSKLFIKTRNAVMGIRGTDFMISTNGRNTAAILFEGEVVFNRLDDNKLLDSSKLDALVDRGVRLFPGEFSAVSENNLPTIPALLNVNQREKLEKSSGLVVSDKPKSIVPPGLSAAHVASAPAKIKADGSERASVKAEAFEKDGRVKPANGSSVDLSEATIIAPSPNAKLDELTNTYIDYGSEKYYETTKNNTTYPDPSATSDTITAPATNTTDPNTSRGEQIIYASDELSRSSTPPLSGGTTTSGGTSDGGVTGGTTSGSDAANDMTNSDGSRSGTGVPTFMQNASRTAP